MSYLWSGVPGPQNRFSLDLESDIKALVPVSAGVVALLTTGCVVLVRHDGGGVENLASVQNIGPVEDIAGSGGGPGDLLVVSKCGALYQVCLSRCCKSIQFP